MDALSLMRGSRFLLAPAQDSRFAQLKVHAGVLRLSTSPHQPLADITVALAGAGQPELLRLDPFRTYVLEAITTSEFSLVYASNADCQEELSTTWLINFGEIRHHLGSDQRINQLLKHLANQFGSPVSEGTSIPFSLPHSRLAEIIGSTRSTVTRHLVRLKERGLLIDHGNHSGLIVTTKLLSMAQRDISQPGTDCP